MNEFFTEHLVKTKNTIATTMKKAGLIIASIIVVFFAFAFLGTLGMFVAIGLFYLDNFLIGRLNVEYEYIFYNGDLDIDKIMNKQSRKRMCSTSVKDLEVIAPEGSDALRPFQGLKVLDFSSKEPGNKKYVMVTSYKGEKVQILMEPNDVILNGMKYLAPRKVVI